ncbi:MAG: c-type cytochrome [Telluria sp.]
MKRWLVLIWLTLALGGCHQSPSIEPLTGGNPRVGEKLIESFGCAACHQIKGVPQGQSQVGPSLKDILKSSYVGGMLPNSADNLMKWIQHPQAVNPKTAMPELGVTETQARDIAAYLYSQ